MSNLPYPPDPNAPNPYGQPPGMPYPPAGAPSPYGAPPSAPYPANNQPYPPPYGGMPAGGPGSVPYPPYGQQPQQPGYPNAYPPQGPYPNAPQNAPYPYGNEGPPMDPPDQRGSGGGLFSGKGFLGKAMKQGWFFITY